jgi:outer membrane protein assembly factor BamA
LRKNNLAQTLSSNYCKFTFFMLKKIIYIFLLLYITPFCFAQKQFFLTIKINEPDSIKKRATLNFEPFYPDSLSLKNAVFTWQKKQLEQGFLTSNIDKIVKKDSTFEYFIFVGSHYEWAKLDRGNIALSELDKIGFRERIFSHKIFNYKELSFWIDKILAFQENNGYPFANLGLDNVLILKNEAILANFNLKKGNFIRFGNLKLDDDSTQINTRYLEHYLDILPNSVFDKSKIKNIKNRLRELPFLTLDGEPYLVFEEEKAIVHLTLKRKQASRFDALLGVLPEKSSGVANKTSFILTGTINLDLQNVLNRGERFVLDFQRFKANQQELKVQVNYPFIANLPIGADLNFGIFRRDSSFTSIEYALGGRYILKGNDYLKLYWQVTQNNVGKIDSSAGFAIAQSRRLPEILDVDASAYGLEFVKQHLDYRFNPRKGWSFLLKTDIGTRKIRKNNNLIDLKNKIDFDFSALYDTIKLSSLRLKSSLQVEFFIPIMQRSTFRLAVRGDGIFAETPVFQNEQFRFGGNRLMRGFDENSILATRFLMGNIEYRFLIGQNSFFNIFTDAAYTENITNKIRNFNNFLGFGAGMTFETRAGIFSLSYALGKKNENPIDLKSGKIHFGYFSLF